MSYVSFAQAEQFCAFVGGTLPTEAQWEFAARNRGQSPLCPWGEGAPSCELCVMQDEQGEGCGTLNSSVVCSRPGGNTAQGLCDMIGNLWEWTADWYHETYSGAPLDGSAWLAPPPGTVRVTRGGAFRYKAAYQNATYRNEHGDPTYQTATVGLRCVKPQIPFLSPSKTESSR